MNSTARTRVLILGGGFAGLACAQALPADRYAVTLIDRNGCFEFLPNIHELISAVTTPELLRLPLAPAMQRACHDFLRQTVVAIDPAARSVRTSRRRTVAYDFLVVALGGVDASHGVSGVAEHAFPFKSVDQCARIGKRLERLASRRKPGNVVIVGGGLEGVEALGEVLRRYRDSALQVTLIEARAHLLPGAPAALDTYLRRLCKRHGVKVRTRSPVQRVEAGSVILRNKAVLPSDLTIWTGGPAPPPLLAESGLAPAKAWAPVNEYLQIADHPEIYTAGDAAELPVPVAKQAYHALDMGEHVARNIQRTGAGRKPIRFRPSDKPMLVSFGDLDCFLIAGKLVVAGAPLSAGKEAVFEAVMAQLDRRALPMRALHALQRGDRAARELLWPKLSSWKALRRQSQVRVLSAF